MSDQILPPFVKARVLEGEQLTLKDADVREGRFGTEIQFNIVRADGSRAAFTLSKSEARERLLRRLWWELESHPDGLPIVLRLLKAEESGFDSDVWLIDPYQGGNQPSEARRAWEAARRLAPGGTGDPSRLPDSAFDSSEPGLDPDDIPF